MGDLDIQLYFRKSRKSKIYHIHNCHYALRIINADYVKPGLQKCKFCKPQDIPINLN